MRLPRRCLAMLSIFCGLASAPAVAVDIIFQDGFQARFGFQVQTPDIMVAAGEAATYCYYFRAPNAATLGVRRWLSSMGAGMHHMILYTTSIERQPPGTLTQSPCGFSAGGGNPAWLYAAHDVDEDLVFPPSDGSGTPLAVEVAAGQFAFLQMYVINPSGQPLTTSALLKAEALDPATSYTKSATYLTFNSNISIPPNSTGVDEQYTCAVPTGAKFWWLSTRTHHYATLAKIRDAAADIVVTTDWEHPAAAIFSTSPFYVFSPSGLTYECVYNNATNRTVSSGDDETLDESCIGIGYFFPATGPMLCLNNIGPF